MTFESPGLFVVWAVVTIFAAFAMGATASGWFLFERMQSWKARAISESQRPRERRWLPDTATVAHSRQELARTSHSRLWRSGRTVHRHDCAHLARADDKICFWALEADEVAQVAKLDKLRACRTCGPFNQSPGTTRESE